MHSPYFLIAMAAMSHALIYSTDQEPAPKTPWRSLLRRQSPPRGTLAPHGDLPENTYTKYYCPQATDQEPTGFTKKRIDVTDLSIAQQQMMDFCGDGKDIDPTTGTLGHVETHGGANVQICNYDDKPWHCTSSILSHLLDEVACGTRDLPSEGFGVLMYNGQEISEKYYVYYTPNAIGNCLDKDGFYNKKWEDPPPNATQPDSQGDGGDGGNGDNGSTDTSSSPFIES